MYEINREDALIGGVYLGGGEEGRRAEMPRKGRKSGGVEFWEAAGTWDDFSR